MKVLFHGFEYPPNGGGVGAYMRNMAQALVQNGHEAVVLCGRAEKQADESEEAGVHVLRGYGQDEIGTDYVGRLVLEVAKSHQVDLIEGADHLGECAWLLGQKQRPPVLIKAHAAQFIRVLEQAQIHYAWQRFTIAIAKARSRRQMNAERLVVEGADALLSPSQRLMDELKGQGLTLPVRRAVLPNPIAVTAPISGRESDRPTLLFVGRLEFLKGVAFLPEILRAVRRVLPDTVLEIVGGDTYARGVGSLQTWLKARFQDQAGHVDIRGRLHGEELMDAYRRAWVVLHPSLWDNFPTVVLESMALGKPIVSTPHGGMPDMLQGTGCPIVDPRKPDYAENVVKLMQDRERRENVGLAVHKRVMTEYNPKRVVGQYFDFARTIV